MGPLGGRLSKVMKARLPRWDWCPLKRKKDQSSLALYMRTEPEGGCVQARKSLSRNCHLDLGLLNL